MSVEEIKYNGKVKQEILSSSEGFITYKRRKRARTSENYTQESGSVSIEELEAMEKSHNTKSHADMYKQGDTDRTENHWIDVLKHMLQLTDGSNGGGIASIITDALNHLPSGKFRKSKIAEVSMDTAEPKDRCKSRKVPDQSTSDIDANKKRCQETFYNILCSEKFVSLCNLLCDGIKVDKLFDIKQINLKMRSGVYGQSPGLFYEDLQLMWKNYQRAGEELVHLASSLSNLSKDFMLNQVGEDTIGEAYPQNNKSNFEVGSVAKNSDVSETGTQFIQSCESVPSTKQNPIEVSFLYKVCTCKKCGTTADVGSCLICDECEAVYHLNCVEPAVQNIPTKSWYCNSCNIKETTTQSFEPLSIQINDTRLDSLHDNCMVCERLEFSKTKEAPTDDNSRESSVSYMESDELPEPSRTALSRLCKQCGTCEDEDKRFLICGHAQCPYKYYHIRCLKTNQIASYQQRNKHCWYCPSCLCRGCFRDQDDEMIVLCDGCDEAHHIYCMKPPRTSIPKGQWYCLQCNIEKAKEGMRMHEHRLIQQLGKKSQANEENGSGSINVLLNVVEKINTDEVKN